MNLSKDFQYEAGMLQFIAKSDQRFVIPFHVSLSEIAVITRAVSGDEVHSFFTNDVATFFFRNTKGPG